MDLEPIPNELVANCNDRALCGQVVPNWIAIRVFQTRGNTEAVLGISLPHACTWGETEALLGAGPGPLLLRPCLRLPSLLLLPSTKTTAAIDRRLYSSGDGNLQQRQ